MSKRSQHLWRMRRFSREAESAGRLARGSAAVCLLIILLPGCRSAGRLESKVAETFAMPERLLSIDSVDTRHLSFADACRRAARVNEDIATKALQVPERDIDIEEAASSVWPRFDVGARVQLVIDDSVETGGDLTTVGLYVSYDIQKALFVADGVAAAEVGRRRAVEQLRLALSSHISRMYVGLAELEFRREAVQQYEAMVAKAGGALDAAEALTEMGNLSPGALLGWQSRVAELSDDLWEARERLSQDSMTMTSHMGGGPGATCVVTDAADVLAVPVVQIPVTTNIAELVTQVWQHRAICKLAETDLLLAEFGIVNAKRKRLPRLTGSAGMGDVKALDEEDVPFVLEVGVSMPLLDCGDVRRQVQKAEARRDAALQQASLLARRVGNEVYASQVALNRAVEGVKRAEALCVSMGNQGRTMESLVALGKADALAEASLELNRLKGEIRVRQALLELRKARAAHAAACGVDLLPGLLDSLAEELAARGPGAPAEPSTEADNE